MECKYTDVRGLGEAFSELIDTLWNVNEVVRIRCDLSTLELIDTLWNVNELQSSSNYKELMELIDTLWNVNKYNRKYVQVKLEN